MSNRQSKAAKLEGAGGQNVAARTGDQCSPLPSSIANFPNLSSIKIDTTSGGPCHWSIVDTLFTLRNVLEARGLDIPQDALVEAWLAMGQASYLKRKDREAWPEVGEVGQ